MNQEFYHTFEDRYRGSRELIRTRLEAYQPFIRPLAQLYPAARAIDLGCGRGEWLELLRECNFESFGIDLNNKMLEACIERGLTVIHGDATDYLKDLDDETVAIVSGFHLVEHISFEKLDVLIKQALRVLKPGGLLILETPNPENLVVGSCNFFLDPTHIRPIPPSLLAFLPEYHGYARVCIARLQEEKALHERSDINLMDVLSGVSPDYAVVAQKNATYETLSQFDAVFSAVRGIDLGQLARRYDQNIANQLTMLNKKISSIEVKTSNLNQTLEHLSDFIQIKLIEELNTSNHHLQQQARVLETELNILRQSRSWRYTMPLRMAVKWLRGGFKKILYAVISIFHKPLAILIKIVLQQPWLKQHINQRLLAYPYLRMQLKEIAQRAGVFNKFFIYNSSTVQSQEISQVLTNLTPRAREIYADLKVAIERKGGCN